MSIIQRIRSWGDSPRAGLLAVFLGLVSALIWAQMGGRAGPLPGGVSGATAQARDGVRLQARLSQPMIVQGEDGNVYLDLSVITPEAPERDVLRGPSDLVVILDRSGSMAQENKWPHAKAAIHSLLDRLEPSDRVSLVSFSETAHVDAALTRATPENLRRLRRIVDSLYPGTSTNLGDGLLAAERIVLDSRQRRRILLLSDGMTNRGIVDVEQLNAIAARIANRGVVVSTIGMGLGFNETLMASIADHGMGRFSYLEHLENLGAILTAELSDSRQLLAEGSEIRLAVPDGVRLVDAAGYPVVEEDGSAVIRTGQLFWGQAKKFIATLRVPNHKIAEYKLGTIRLDYRTGDRTRRLELKPGRLQIACVAPERKTEAVASVDRQIFLDAWRENNLGLLMKKVAEEVRAGDASAARKLLGDYRSEVAEADALAPGVKAESEAKVKELEARVDEAFRGRDQKTKQNRRAKALHKASQTLQRPNK